MNFDEERALATVAHEAIVEMRRKRRWKIFFRIFWALYWLLLLSFLFGLKGSDPKSEGASYRGKHLAVVSVQGMIASDMEANADDIISGLEKAFKNPMAEAVILEPSEYEVLNNACLAAIKKSAPFRKMTSGASAMTLSFVMDFSLH